ncbi:MAG: cytochrome c [Planctomycetes bacterium]|nr:cytochrome c [Planctomycetota bacterium]
MAMFSNKTITLLPLLAATFALAGCDDFRGFPAEKPPVHLVLDMDFQPKVTPQSKLEFEGWKDGRGARRPVSDPFGNPLVVAKGSLPDAKYAFRDGNGQYVTSNPLPLDHKFMVRGKQMSVIDRGRERYEIFCSVCHGQSGRGGNGPAGHGAVGRRWPNAVPSFHFNAKDGADNRVANLPDGEIFDTITTGKGTTMPAYAARISVEDRWAIVHYVRALQSLSN